jgi:nucleotide-binding universal stress UspA family protein
LIHDESPHGKILIPVSSFFDRKSLVKALRVLAVLKDATIVVFHIVEVPQMTTPLDPTIWDKEIKKAEGFLDELAVWLEEQGYKVEKKVKTARDSAEGIVLEANNGEYSVVLLLKRRMARSWTRSLRRSISERVIRDANPPVLTLLAEPELAEKRAGFK